MDEFYTILTTRGIEAEIRATGTGVPVKLTHMAVGDGLNGAYYEPYPEQTALKNERWRGVLNAVGVDPDIPNRIIAEAIVPVGAGPFFVREVGLFTDAGELYAVGKFPLRYLPGAGSGAVVPMRVLMIVTSTNAAAVQVVIDESLINGTVMSGASTFNGTDGITITHNLGQTNYVVTATPLAGADKVGGIWYIRAANTCTIFNTGQAGIPFTFALGVDAGMDSPSQWSWRHYGGLRVDGPLWAKNLLETSEVRPDGDAVRSLGTALLRYLNGHFAKLTLGGVEKASWDLAASGLNGLVMSGVSTFGGIDGITITHNIGATNYVITATPLASAEKVGGIWYVRAANTVTVFNTGAAGVPFTVTIEVDAGMTSPSQWLWRHYGGLQVDGVAWFKNLIETLNLRPDIDAAREVGDATHRYLNGNFVRLTLGGSMRESWPMAVAGSNGNVFYSGFAPTGGMDGITISHFKGDTNYLLKVLPRGLEGLGKYGEISYVKAANTCTVYNTGNAGLLFDFEFSNVA